MEFADLPDNWQEVKYDTDDGYHAVWACEDDHVAIDVQSNVDGKDVGYTAVVYQHISDEGLETEIQTHARTATSRQEVEELAADFMQEVNDGHHVLHVIGHEEWREFIQFYCIGDDDVPDGLTAEELIEGLDNEEFDDQIDELPEDFDPNEYADEMITVDVFPRHKTEVSGYTES